MAFLEDPRLRQRWNQITHDAEAVTENAAAGIWSFQHHYINPCLGSIANSIEQCTSVCLGNAEERLRRRRERERERAEQSFDFYDDWYEEEQQSGGLLGGWSGEDWDRLLAGTGSQRRHTGGGGGATTEQPRRKRGMSYGTRAGGRRTKTGTAEDPTIIPSTQPIGLLSKLPWKLGGRVLRYKPSAADLQEHPGKSGTAEAEPLLGGSDDESLSDFGEVIAPRKRSDTTGSGDTSDSYRSRGDLFPSDGEGEEDAVALDGEVTYDMIRKDDRSSGKTRKSSKGKRPAFGGSRTVSRTTIASVDSRGSLRLVRTRTSSASLPHMSQGEEPPSLEDLAVEEESLQREEDEKISKQKMAAQVLATKRGLKADNPDGKSGLEVKPDVAEDEVYEPEHERPPETASQPEPRRAEEPCPPDQQKPSSSSSGGDEFVPARLPYFG